ncbi:hypothetical protein Taro_038662 [Colocasia esculenta]|uniref:Uncharacterized protein n=1 Tax=Colocasia esculenta TaxID=4460 RepID=A0A843WPA7_COLES|nr:hypothetical protein [Colocasia esculenta]
MADMTLHEEVMRLIKATSLPSYAPFPHTLFLPCSCISCSLLLEVLLEVLLEELLELLLGVVAVAPATTSISAPISSVAAIFELPVDSQPKAVDRRMPSRTPGNQHGKRPLPQPAVLVEEERTHIIPRAISLRKRYARDHFLPPHPSHERSQAAKCNRSTHPKKNVHTSGSVSYATHSQKLHHELERAPTFRELFDQTHKRKGTDDYVSESARTIAETYDRMMTDRYAEGTPQPDLDPEAWVDATGGPRKGRVYGFGDSLDTTPVLSSYASSVAPPAYASSSAASPSSGVEDMRTLIREELRTHLGIMVEQLISAMQGVRSS